MKNIIITIFCLLIFVTSNGQEAKTIKQDKIDLQMSFYENLSATKQNGNWGFVNKKNVWVIKLTFKDVSFFVKGLCVSFKTK